MRILFLDTETTGLPAKKGLNTPRNLDRYIGCRLMQLALILDDGKTIEEYDSLVELEKGVKVHPGAQEKNGLSWDMCFENGEPLQTVLGTLERFLAKTELIVAHNIEFDIGVLASECYRCGRDDLADKLRNKKRYCTWANGNHKSLFSVAESLGIPTENFKAHTAVDDTKVCREIYLKQTEKPVEKRVEKPVKQTAKSPINEMLKYIIDESLEQRISTLENTIKILVKENELFKKKVSKME